MGTPTDGVIYGVRLRTEYDYRKQNRKDVIADVLDWVYGLKKLGRAEIDWIAYLRRQGQPLLNLADGGLRPTGVIWTAEMREAVRIRSTGRPEVRRFGEGNPLYQESERREVWS
ncbi:hypothetical protein ACFWM1_34550 [Nocardia sp. NPDC058379]|uniref:hypothetical protein n=1 Tax=unclassified Nocardia TaxID=2637762 RepID=UPI00365B9689